MPLIDKILEESREKMTTFDFEKCYNTMRDDGEFCPHTIMDLALCCIFLITEMKNDKHQRHCTSLDRVIGMLRQTSIVDESERLILSDLNLRHMLAIIEKVWLEISVESQPDINCSMYM